MRLRVDRKSNSDDEEPTSDDVYWTAFGDSSDNCSDADNDGCDNKTDCDGCDGERLQAQDGRMKIAQLVGVANRIP